MKAKSTLHVNLLKKRLLKEGINLETDKLSLSNTFSRYFDVYKMPNGNYAVLPVQGKQNKSSLAFCLRNLDELKDHVSDLENPVIKKKNIFYVRNESAIIKINEYQPHQFQSSLQVGYIKDPENYKIITKEILKLPQGDENLLSWIYYTGEHIKHKFGGVWGLRKIVLGDLNYFVPLIIGFNEEIWNVGDFCHQIYYRFNKMSNISYNSYYIGNIESFNKKSKSDDINNKVGNILTLE